MNWGLLLLSTVTSPGMHCIGGQTGLRHLSGQKAVYTVKQHSSSRIRLLPQGQDLVWRSSETHHPSRYQHLSVLAPELPLVLPLRGHELAACAAKMPCAALQAVPIVLDWQPVLPDGASDVQHC